MVAIALPAAIHQDCPPAPLPQPCIPVNDPHAFLRFAIVALGAIPVLVVIGRGGLGDRRWFGWGILLATVAAAVLLALPHGLVPMDRGDCPPYPRCFTPGRPYLTLAWCVFLLGACLWLWLWLWAEPSRPDLEPAV